MDSPLVLYYTPFSSASQRARNVLEEKGLKYQEVKINLYLKETYEPWFMKMNPKGQVPVLQHGDKYIPDSVAIVKYLEENFAGTPRLVPDESTEEGAICKQICDMCQSVTYHMITYFISKYPDFVTNSLMPDDVLKLILETFTNGDNLSKELSETGDKNPELQAVYLAKAKDAEAMGKIANHPNLKELVEQELQKCRDIFETLEKQLQKHIDASQAENWLCGPSYTMADIEVGILMRRLLVTGAAKGTWKNGNYSNLEKFYQRLAERTSFRECSYSVLPVIRVK